MHQLGFEGSGLMNWVENELLLWPTVYIGCQHQGMTIVATKEDEFLHLFQNSILFLKRINKLTMYINNQKGLAMTRSRVDWKSMHTNNFNAIGTLTHAYSHKSNTEQSLALFFACGVW